MSWKCMLTAWSTDCSASKVINPKPSQRPRVNQGSRGLWQHKMKNSIGLQQSEDPSRLSKRLLGFRWRRRLAEQHKSRETFLFTMQKNTGSIFVEDFYCWTKNNNKLGQMFKFGLNGRIRSISTEAVWQFCCFMPFHPNPTLICPLVYCCGAHTRSSHC